MVSDKLDKSLPALQAHMFKLVPVEQMDTSEISTLEQEGLLARCWEAHRQHVAHLETIRRGKIVERNMLRLDV